MLTKNGIQLDIKKSDYICVVDSYKFYFSSELYRTKFINELSEYISSETIKLKYKYKVNIVGKIFFAISLYKKIEKRGFYIKDLQNDIEIKENPYFLININE